MSHQSLACVIGTKSYNLFCRLDLVESAINLQFILYMLHCLCICLVSIFIIYSRHSNTCVGY